MEKLKLQKFIQGSGFGSRREVRGMIAAGEFTVNHQVTDDPNLLIDPGNDIVKYGKKRIGNVLEKKVYFLFNKPLGVISTLNDPQGRATLSDYIKRIRERVYPVGRLDYNSEGLILLTNDGELTNFIISPRNKIPKVYLVKIKGTLTPDQKEKLIKKGVFVDDRKVRAQRIEFVKKTQTGNSWVRVTIVEGKKHIIRKMFRFSGHPVDRLRRVQIGNFSLKEIPSGQWREITAAELDRFKKEYRFQPTGTA